MSGVALAGDVYVSGNAGVSLFQDAENSGTGFSGENDFNTGYVVSGAGGMKFTGGLRLEVEGSYRQANIDRLTSLSVGGTGVPLGNGLDGGGDVSVFAGMVNGAYDVNTGTAWTPYLMGGIGAARISINDASVSGVSLADDADLVFAYQAGAGLNYALTEAIQVGAGYRYFATMDPSFTANGGKDFESELRTHNIMLSVTYGF
jgi:OOP family OmpA-OmpF porin